MRTIRSIWFNHQKPVLVGSFAILGLLAAWASTPAAAEPPPPIEEISTFIPHGYLLIPVDLKNADQLEGLLGARGVVDLFEDIDRPGARSRLVGRRLRLLRAPLNPKTFAVLIRETEAERFLSFQGPLIASVRPLESGEHELARTATTRAKPQIEFQEETP